MEEIRTNYLYTTKMKMVGFFKTDNIFLDSILSVIGMSIIGYIINYIYDNRVDKLLLNLSFHNIKCIFYRGKKKFYHLGIYTYIIYNFFI